MAFSLSADQKTKFDEDGYLVLKGFVPKCTLKELHDRIKKLLAEFSLEGHPMTTFETGEGDSKHVGDDYFLESADKVRFFFEPKAFTDGKLNRAKEDGINKIGHGLHIVDPVFRQFTLENEDLKTLARALDFEDPRVVQSMTIHKPPSIGGAVNSHCDSTFLYSDPISAKGLWFALEDCTPTNGCLSFVPGSHKINKITHRLVRVDGGGTEIQKIPLKEGEAEPELPDWDGPGIDWVCEPCEAGDLVLIHGSVIHRSEANLSDKSRFIYTFHMIEGSAVWDEKNWLQPTPGVPFTKLLE